MYPAPRYREVPGDARDPGILRSRAASRFPPERPDGGSRFFPIDREIARRIRSTPLPATGGDRPKTSALFVTNRCRASRGPREATCRVGSVKRNASIKTILTMTAIYRHCSNARAHYAVIIVNYYLKFPRRRLVLRESICLPLASSCVAGIFLLPFSIPRITTATRSALITTRYERHPRDASLRGHVTDPLAKIFAALSAFFNAPRVTTRYDAASVARLLRLLLSISLSLSLRNRFFLTE